MTDSPLHTEIQYVKGVGPRRAELYANLGLATAEDLLWDLPRDVLDLTDVRSVRDLEADVLVSVRGQVANLDGRNIRGGRNLTAVLLDCGDGFLRGVWFNQPWMLRRFRMGDTVLFSGKPKRRSGRWEINNPRVQWLEEDDTITSGGVLPRYRLTEGLRMEHRRAAARAAIEMCAGLVPELLPDSFREQHDLPGISQALSGVHTPKTLDEFKTSRNRLLFDDLFEFQLGLALKRRMFREFQSAPVLPTNAKIDSRIRRLFPFEFTEGQNAAIREIADDLASGRAMHRLLQADVGAGKTVVAIYAMLVTVAAGCQTALMAPTEVLAQQHWETLEEALRHSRVERRLLTGQLTAADRRKTLEDIRTGDVQLVVGTQALIQSDVEFRNLGLAVIDEQHKFGVMQRAHFSMHHQASDGHKPAENAAVDDRPHAPHILVMTATPIPRSLCLTVFGDLDSTVISELPPGRQKVVTTRIREAGRAKVWDFLRKQLAAGRQAYVVCPRVEDAVDQTGEFVSAESVVRSLREGELADFRVGLAHGQMSRDEKASAMAAFREGETQVLVSTTVIEVGVDVPNATLMVILQAERFGLSQLHQLRGRVSRGRFQGYCFLFSDSDADEAGKRLWALESTTDGFRIAETDFEIRGPGDVLGARQHGELPLRVADIRRDADLLKDARAAAFDLVQAGAIDAPEFAPLKTAVLERFGEWLNLPQTG